MAAMSDPHLTDGQVAETRPSKRHFDPVNRLIGLHLRSWRLAREMTLSQLADGAGITYQLVQKYESGETTVSVRRLMAFAELLRVRPSQLIDDIADPEAAPVVTELSPAALLSIPDAVRLLRAFGAIDNADVRQKLVALIEAIAFGRDTDAAP